MGQVLKVDGATSTAWVKTTMQAEGLEETAHLEQWIADHPEVIDPALKVITTQYQNWASEVESARERPDVLALSTSGELVVIELKRGGDRKIHLQALTYAALVAGFTKESLVGAHVAWLERRGGETTIEAASEQLSQHVESDWEDTTFELPRIVLVAEAFSGQVLTTVQWLAAVAPGVSIECHEYELFREVATGSLCASFQRLFPVVDLEGQRLRPSLVSAPQAAEVKDQVTKNRRRAKSVKIIHDHGLIPEGARLDLRLSGYAKPDVVEAVGSWVKAEPDRGEVTWISDPTRPLRWALHPDERWTPSSLRNEIFRMAGQAVPTFSAADAWHHDGHNLYVIASRAEDLE